jgi:hypothetical protein
VGKSARWIPICCPTMSLRKRLPNNMPARFTDARELLSDLLDRHESGTVSPIGYPDYSAFADVVAMDKFARETAKRRPPARSGSQTARDGIAIR